MQRRRYFYKFIIFVILLFIVPSVHAEYFYYKQILLKAGLPSTVRGILRDQRGFVWIATKSGLGRFDGYEMKRYLHLQDNPYSLPNNFIHQIAEDEQHNLWILTEKGIARYQYKTDDFSLLTDETGEAVVAYSICRTENGLLFGSQKKVYFYSYKDSKIQETIDLEINGTFNITSLILLDQQTLLCCNRWEGVYLYDLKTRRNLPAPFNLKNEISSIFVDSQQQLWISFYNEGLFCYKRNGDLVASYTTRNSSLSSNIILSIAERKGKIWVGTDGHGINILDPVNNQFSLLKHISGEDKFSLPANSIFCLYNDHYDNMWIGSIHKGLISISEVYMKTYTNMILGSDLGLSNSTVLSLYQRNPEQLWIGTNGGGINCFDPLTEKFTHYPSTWDSKVASISGFTSDKLLLSFFSEGVYIFDISTGEKQRFVIIDEATTARLCTHGNTVNLYQNTPNTVLLLGDQVYVYNIKKKKFTIAREQDTSTVIIGAFLPITHNEKCTYLNDTKCIYELDHNTNLLKPIFTCNGDTIINTVSSDEYGNFWIGSNYGLKYYNIQTKEQADISNSLFTEVSSLICDQKGKVWIGADNMLFVWMIEDKRFAIFGESDGALPNEYLPKPRLISVQGDVYMGGVQGLLQIKDQVSTNITDFPNLLLSDVLINGELANNRLESLPTRISVPSKSNISIRIMSNEKDIFRQKRYRYLIKGLDDEYTESYNPELVMRSLPSGEYDVLVSCTTNDGEWAPDQQVLLLNVLPPWYKTWWFILFCIFLVSIIIFYSFRMMMKRKEEKMLLAIKEHEKQTYEEKVRFLINISHELRTPLTLIYAPLSRMLKSLSPNDAQYLPLQLVYRQAQRMKNLINMVLDVRKMEVGESKLQLYPYSLNQWIEDVSADFVSEGGAKNIQVSFNFDPQINNVSFDKNKCEIILSNLLINALKYSPENSEIIISSVLLQGENRVRILVKDQGKGLDKVDKQKLFTRFYQGEESQSGTGIGLSYSRILAELHGGSIGVMDNVDRGVTFFFELPSREDSEEFICQPKPYLNELMTENSTISLPEELDYDTRSHTILVVDDNTNLTDFLEKSLTEYFKKVIVASNGVEALRLVKDYAPDIVVSDIMMPQMNGYDLCKNIKEDISISHIPVILLTARGDKDSQISGYKNGADAYLTKPFEVDILMEIIRNRLKNRQFAKNKYSSQGIIPAPEDTTFSQADEIFLLKLNKIIIENIDKEDLGVPFICQEIGMSRASLYNKLKVITNMGANDYINKFRMEKAISLINNTDMTFSQISEQVGFSTLSYFSRAFKQYTGKSPSQFRGDRQ